MDRWVDGVMGRWVGRWIMGRWVMGNGWVDG